MKVLLIGSGGREHAMAWALARSPRLSQLLIAPGNPGTSKLGRNVPVGAEDLDGLLELARSESVDLTVVGPETPLVNGIVDRFRSAGLPIAGPTRAAAALEGSKVFAKDFMRRHAIPTGAYQVFSSAEEAEEALDRSQQAYPLVVKADGLAAGKGVFVCPDRASALEAVGQIARRRRFGDAGDRLLLEEFLQGEEASFMVLTDGDRIIPLPPSQDHKAVFDGDRGPNTGGMGAYSSDSILGEELRERILEQIIRPTVQGMKAEGESFSGVLYAGLMLTGEGPKVLEFNVRLGDPEAQVVLPRLEGDLLAAFEGLARRDLSTCKLEWSKRPAVAVVVACGGYPGPFQSGHEISGLDLVIEVPGTTVFHAGTRVEGDGIVTSGGRVLAVTAQADSLEDAVIKAYEGVNKIHFQGMHWRRDIAAKGLGRRNAR